MRPLYLALLRRDQVICEQLYNLKANLRLCPLKLFTFRQNQPDTLAFICSFPLISAFRPTLSLSAPIRDLFFSSADQRLGALVCAKKPILLGGGEGVIYFLHIFVIILSFNFLGCAAFIISALRMHRRKSHIHGETGRFSQSCCLATTPDQTWAAL